MDNDARRIDELKTAVMKLKAACSNAMVTLETYSGKSDLWLAHRTMQRLTDGHRDAMMEIGVCIMACEARMTKLEAKLEGKDAGQA